MLFEEYTNFNYQFPEPQYLGAKHTHLAWIQKFVPDNVKTAIDAFAGSHSVAFLFKQMGFKTISNDFLNFNNQKSRQTPGLHFIGEVVDVTGQLGGFNFQWAWSSGWCAGQAV